MKRMIFVVFMLFGLNLLSFADNSATVEQSKSSSRILTVTHVDKHINDAGRVIDYSGKRHYDKFYQLESMVSEDEAGEEYLVRWISGDAYENLVLKFEYITIESLKVFEKTINIESVQKGIQQTTIEHRGPEYKEQGKIRSWHVTVYHGDQMLAEKKSAFWSDRLSN